MILSGTWRNHGGYSLEFSHVEKGRLFDIVIWEFRLDPQRPLQWVTDDGRVLEACRRVKVRCMDAHGNPTDGGSVPFFVAWYIDRWLCPRAFPIHNAGYGTGVVWCVEGDTSYPIWLSRAEFDELLYWQAQSDNATANQARAIWGGVRGGGWWAWHKHAGDRERVRKELTASRQ